MKKIILQSAGSELLESSTVQELVKKQQKALNIIGGKENVTILADAIEAIFKQKQDLFKKIKGKEKEITIQSKFNKLYSKILLEAQQDDDDEGQGDGDIYKINVKGEKSLRITKVDGSQLNEEQIKKLAAALLEKDKKGQKWYKRLLKGETKLSIKNIKEDDEADENQKKQIAADALKNIKNAEIKFDNINVKEFEINKDAVKNVVELAAEKLNTNLKQQAEKTFKKVLTDKNFSIAAATILAALAVAKVENVILFGK